MGRSFTVKTYAVSIGATSRESLQVTSYQEAARSSARQPRPSPMVIRIFFLVEDGLGDEFFIAISIPPACALLNKDRLILHYIKVIYLPLYVTNISHVSCFVKKQSNNILKKITENP